MTPATLEYLAVGLTLAAVWLIGSLHISGQYLMLLAQAVWFAFAIRQGHRGLGWQSVVLALLTGKAIWGWQASMGRWW